MDHTTVSQFAHVIWNAIKGSVRDRPSIRCIQLAFTLRFIHTHFSHRDGAASARAQSQRGAHTLPHGTHGCKCVANIFCVHLDNYTSFMFKDEDLSTKRRWGGNLDATVVWMCDTVWFSAPARGEEKHRRVRSDVEEWTNFPWNF